jgi:hypothetical protein
MSKELLDKLAENTRRLIEQHRNLSKQIANADGLKEKHLLQIQQLHVDKEMLMMENQQLKEQIKNIKLAQSLTAGEGDQSSRQVKTKINEYIREIDRCLSLLNRE